MRLAICQLSPVRPEPRARAEEMFGILDSVDADMYVFPEMYLTGYVHADRRDELEDCLRSVRREADRRRICIVFGAPSYEDGAEYNCAYAFSDEGIAVYRKIHLPGFGAFDEDSRYLPGKDPAVFRFRDMRFGLSVCYDVFFPELFKWNSMHGADVNICISASPEQSKAHFEKVLPARAIENTSYLVFVNNIGTSDGISFFGGSRVLSPMGDMIAEVSDGTVAVADLNRSVLVSARDARPVLRDTVPL